MINKFKKEVVDNYDNDLISKIRNQESFIGASGMNPAYLETFCNAQDIFSKSIAEDVVAKILYFNRNIKHYINQ